jgi:hypothetical protein
MPTVEYPANTLAWTEQTETVENPETGETKTVTTEHPKRPFEVRISKWLKQNGVYQLHGFVSATEFGQQLASQSDPYAWLTDNYQTAAGVDEQVVGQWVNGVGAVTQAELGPILKYGNVSPVSATVTDDRATRFDFLIELDGPETFNIEWLTVDFEPQRGG